MSGENKGKLDYKQLKLDDHQYSSEEEQEKQEKQEEQDKKSFDLNKFIERIINRALRATHKQLII